MFDNRLRVAAKNRLAFIAVMVGAHDEQIRGNPIALRQKLTSHVGTRRLEGADLARNAFQFQIPVEFFRRGAVIDGLG